MVHVGGKKNLCQVYVDDIFHKSVIKGKEDRIDIIFEGKGEKEISVMKYLEER